MTERSASKFKTIGERRATKGDREEDQVERCEGNERREQRKEG